MKVDPLALHTPGGVSSHPRRLDVRRSIPDFTSHVNPSRYVQDKTLTMAVGQNPKFRNRGKPFTEIVPRNGCIVAGEISNINNILKPGVARSNGLPVSQAVGSTGWRRRENLTPCRPLT